MPESTFDRFMIFLFCAILVAVTVAAIIRSKAAKEFMAGLREGKQPAARLPSSLAGNSRPTVSADRGQPPSDASFPSGKAAPLVEIAAPSDAHMRRPRIFVSYRREDSADVAGRIYDRLLHRFGDAAVFKDVDSIPLGSDFRLHIDEAVSSATVVLVVVGRSWLSEMRDQRRIDSPKDFVRIEVAAALRRRIPVFPLLVAGATMPDAESLPEEIRDFSYRNAVPVRSDPDFSNDMDRLIRAIAKLHGPPA
jgi:hypothetical protein